MTPLLGVKNAPWMGSLNVSVPWDVTDDMDYATQPAFNAVWVPTSTRVDGNPITKKIDIEADTNTQNDIVYFDATSMSDTKNISRFIVDITTFVQNSIAANVHAVFIILSDNTSSATVAQDHYGFLIQAQITGGNVFSAINGNGTRPDSSSRQDFATSPGTGALGLQDERNSSTSATVSIFNTAFSSLTEAEVIVVSSSMVSLQFAKILAFTQSTNGNITLTLDNFRLNKTTDVPGTG